MNQDGKTLMELMIVLTLVGILTALAGPNFLLLKSRMDIHSMTQEIASELRLARQVALTQRERMRCVIDPDQQLVAVQFVNRGTTYRTYRYAGTGISIDEPSAGPEIIFHPSGRSATATTIRLRAQDGQVHKLTVGITGRVSVL